MSDYIGDGQCAENRPGTISKSANVSKAIRERPVPHTMDVDSICDYCYHFWTGEREELSILAHGLERDMGKMRESADAGCHCCAIFLANVALNKPFKDEIELGDNNRIFVMLHRNMLALLRLLGDGTARTRLRFILREGRQEFVDKLAKHGHEAWTGSPCSLAQSKEWLRQCEETHPECRSPDPAYCPSRLLFIDTENKAVRLRSRGSVPDRAKYAALSHCWGETRAVCLRKDNSKVLQEGVSIAELAKTFQEAIRVCQEFHLEYIWIDCYCIMQEDPEDWATECITMQSVYGNAYLTLAATDAKNSHEGLFRERHAKVVQPFRLSIVDMMPASEQTDGDLAETLKTVEETWANSEGVFFLTDIDLVWERLEESPLNRRAWAVQERILSPRVLHFDKDQLVWECDSLTACERFPGPTGLEGLVPAQKRVRASIDKLRCRHVTDRPLGQELHDSWRPIIKAYTSAGLTKQTDRLIALEGIAQWLAQTYSCLYVAGLFTRNMESQLAWRLGNDPDRQAKGTHRRIPVTKIAPSWSWASFLGEIDMLSQWQSVDSEESYRAIQGVDLCEIVLCQITNKDALAANWTPMDRFRELPLEISCFLVQIRFPDFAEIKTWPEGRHDMRAWPENGSPVYSSEYLPFEEDRPLDDLWPLAFASGGGGSTSYGIHNGNYHASLIVETISKQQADTFFVSVEFDFWEHYREHRTCLLMPTYEVTQYEAQGLVEKTNVRVTRGLVLERRDTTTNQFCRIGMFTLKWNHRATFWRAAVNNDIPGLTKQMVKVDTWPELDIDVSSTAPYHFEKREQAPQYQIVVL